jgi:hypothetical protein
MINVFVSAIISETRLQFFLAALFMIRDHCHGFNSAGKSYLEFIILDSGSNVLKSVVVIQLFCLFELCVVKPILKQLWCLQVVKAMHMHLWCLQMVKGISDKTISSASCKTNYCTSKNVLWSSNGKTSLCSGKI